VTAAPTIVACPSCGRRNRVRATASGVPRCSVCYHVQGIPLLVVIRDEAEVDRLVGAVPAGHLRAMLERHVAAPSRADG
jgi:hypothetical protein